MNNLTSQQAALKERFVEERGYWLEAFDGLLALDESFFEAYLNFSTVPWKQGFFEPMVKELIYIAVDAATTHLYEPGLRVHLRRALEHGATKEELMEVSECISPLGAHTLTMGVPVLWEELIAAGKAEAPEELTPRQEELKSQFIEARGYWADFWTGLLTLDEQFFEAYLDFSSVPWRQGHLEPKVKELIYIAIDSVTTHLYEEGLRAHIRNALKYGASKEEIMEVYELVSEVGIHTVTMGVPALLEELDAVSDRG